MIKKYFEICFKTFFIISNILFTTHFHHQTLIDQRFASMVVDCCIIMLLHAHHIGRARKSLVLITTFNGHFSPAEISSISFQLSVYIYVYLGANSFVIFRHEIEFKIKYQGRHIHM